jgi:hypothetical protein
MEQYLEQLAYSGPNGNPTKLICWWCVLLERSHDCNAVNSGIFSLTGAYQQTTSGVSYTNQDCYEGDSGCFSVYGYEYQTGYVSPIVVEGRIGAPNMAWLVPTGTYLGSSMIRFRGDCKRQG